MLKAMGFSASFRPQRIPEGTPRTVIRGLAGRPDILEYVFLFQTCGDRSSAVPQRFFFDLLNEHEDGDGLLPTNKVASARMADAMF
jgi:hypothetical protein